jgi:AraC-like DNA-binding protein
MFQRIFANIAGMSLNEYIRKRRLTQAAVDIMGTDEKIIDIALKYGYSSAIAFSSAFKNFHGMSPSGLKRSGLSPKSFQRLTFTLILTEKGVGDMQFYNAENAEYLMRRIVNKEHKMRYLQNIAEHNGVKCASDGYRALIMLPNGAVGWDLSDAYFDTDDADKPRFELDPIFNHRDEKFIKFCLSKEQAALMLVSMDGAKTDHKRKCIVLPKSEQDFQTPEAIVCLDMHSMGMITETS